MTEALQNISKSLFSKYGIKTVSMDDISRDARVSKKTIYQFFHSKEILIEGIVQKLLLEHSLKLSECNKNASNAVDAVMSDIQGPFTVLTAFSPSFYYDIKKYFPGAWKLIVNHFVQTISAEIKSNLERGIAEGLYRKNLDINFTADLRLFHFSSSLFPAEPEMFSNTSRDVIEKLTIQYLYGITSLDGRKLLEESYLVSA